MSDLLLLAISSSIVQFTLQLFLRQVNMPPRRSQRSSAAKRKRDADDKEKKDIKTDDVNDSGEGDEVASDNADEEDTKANVKADGE